MSTSTCRPGEARWSTARCRRFQRAVQYGSRSRRAVSGATRVNGSCVTAWRSQASSSCRASSPPASSPIHRALFVQGDPVHHHRGDERDRHQPDPCHPSRQHLFGTDSAGRDTFSRDALRHSHLCTRRHLRRAAFDADRHDHRRARWVLRRLERQPADADDRPVPDLTPAGGLADRVEVPRQQHADHARDPHSLSDLDQYRAHRARCLPVPAREGIRRGRARGRGRRPPDHASPHDPELGRADRGRGDAHDRNRDLRSRRRSRSSASASARRRRHSAPCSTRVRRQGSTSGGSSPIRAS